MRLELSNQPLLEPVGFFEALTATKSLTFHLACMRFHQACSTSTNPSSGFESQTRLSSRPARVRRTGPTSSIMSRGNTLVSSNGSVRSKRVGSALACGTLNAIGFATEHKVMAKKHSLFHPRYTQRKQTVEFPSTL